METKIIGLNYNTSELSNKFLKHPNNEVYNAVKLLFVEAIEEKFVSSEEIRETIKKGYISEKIIKH